MFAVHDRNKKNQIRITWLLKLYKIQMVKDLGLNTQKDREQNVEKRVQRNDFQEHALHIQHSSIWIGLMKLLHMYSRGNIFL